MNDIICFDKVAEAKAILKSGVKEKSVHARKELRIVAWYLINKTTYTKKQIEGRLRSVSEDYFKGMPQDYIDKSIGDIISSVEVEDKESEDVGVMPSITIYKEELNAIEALGHEDTERLAFAFLCMAKMIPYEQIFECNSKLYQLAWKYKYDSKNKKVLEKTEKRRVGGTTPTTRVNTLCKAGIVKFATRINPAFKVAIPTAVATFSVPILCKEGEEAFKIEKPDEDSLILYYDRYIGYGNIVTCERCAKPVLRSGRRQKYCSSCADWMNHHPEKRDL